MRRIRLTDLYWLALCATGVGCRTGDALAEYRPGMVTEDYHSERAAEVMLWRYETKSSPEVRAALKADGSKDSSMELPVTELLRAKVDGRESVGFRNTSGHLVAIAGTSVIPLPPGHYCWYMIGEDPQLTVWPEETREGFTQHQPHDSNPQMITENRETVADSW